jgi:NADH-quinone oxidoreductase subunit C
MLPEALANDPLAQSVEGCAAGCILDGGVQAGELTLEIDPAHLLTALRRLKTMEQFERLCSVTAVDWHPASPRFEVVYHLHSIATNRRLRLKCRAAEGEAIESATQVYGSAGWYEREVFDLFGVSFKNHPDLRRIMMPDYWEGHPLRRDFPIHGHKYSYQHD